MPDTSFLKALISLIKGKRSIIFWLSIIFTSLVYIYLPFFKPTITLRPPPLSFVIEIPKEFKELKLTFEDATTIDAKHKITILPKKEINRFIEFPKDFASERPTILTINNPFTKTQSILEEPENKNIGITIFLKNRSPVKIASIYILMVKRLKPKRSIRRTYFPQIKN